jgi:hypothetical protein
MTVVLFGCTTTGGQVAPDQVKQKYFSFVEKYVSSNHNYVADYDVVDNSTQPEQYWAPNGSINYQKFTPVMKLDKMTVFFLSNEIKFDIRTDVTILTNLTNPEHTTETLAMQNFILSDYNKSFVCSKDKCVEQKMNSPLVMPTKEQAMATLNDQNITITLLPKIAELPADSTCFQLVESKMINCYLDDGILAYMGNETAHIKLKTLQRDILTDNNFALPHIPSQN